MSGVTPQRRQSDRSNAQAGKAIEGALALFGAWRNDLARFTVQSERHSTSVGRAAMLARCQSIADEVRKVRVALLAELMDAPRKVAGHSRVADVERALDGIELAVRELRAKLGN